MAQHIAQILLVVLAVNTFTFAQTIKTAASLDSVTLKAFTYFEHIEGGRFDDYLNRLRPVALAPELRARVLNMISKDDLVLPSAQGRAKLESLEPILKYHQRNSVIELRVLRAPTATAVFLAGAAVIITEPALEILTAEELQAVVAHELGHEYYWNEFEVARHNHDYSTMQELELRCDGIAVVTLDHVGVNPESLISAITKLNKYNERPGSLNSPNYVAFQERSGFIRSMAELLRGRSIENQATDRKNSVAKSSESMSWYEQGLTLQRRGHNEEAVAAFRRAIQLSPDFALAYNELGSVFTDLGRYSEAIKALKEAIRLKPDLAQSLNNLGVVYTEMGRYGDAVEPFKEAIRLRPDDVIARNNLGSSYYELGSYKAAIETYSQATTLKPDDARSHRNLGRTYVKLRRYKDAIDSLARAIRLRSDFGEAFNDLGVAYEGDHQYKQAVDSFNQAIRLEPEMADAYFNLGAAYLKLNERDKALEQYSKLRLLDLNRADKLYRIIYKDKLLGPKGSNSPRPQNYRASFS
jgi:tetratricopeptide (TPR) repeat protein